MVRMGCAWNPQAAGVPSKPSWVWSEQKVGVATLSMSELARR